MRIIIHQNLVLNAWTQTWICASPGTLGVGYSVFQNYSTSIKYLF
jgi:hypothetical protein